MHAFSKKPARSVQPIGKKHANLDSKASGGQKRDLECAEESYICDKTIVDEFNYFRTCGATPQLNAKNTSKESECTDYELNDYLYKKCGARPRPGSPNNCRLVGMGKPVKALGGWNKTPKCAEWATCMKLY